MSLRRGAEEHEPTLIIFSILVCSASTPRKKCWEELGDAQAALIEHATLIDPVHVATMYTARLLFLLPRCCCTFHSETNVWSSGF